MSTTFVLIRGSGQYSDRDEEVVAASKDKKKLQSWQDNDIAKKKREKEIAIAFRKNLKTSELMVPRIEDEPFLEKCRFTPQTKEDHANRAKVKADFRKRADNWLERVKIRNEKINKITEEMTRKQCNLKAHEEISDFEFPYSYDYTLKEVEEL